MSNFNQHNRISNNDELFAQSGLPQAVRPARHANNSLQVGFRHDKAEKDLHGQPVIVAAVPFDKLLDTFEDLAWRIGNTVDVILETSHHSRDSTHRDLHREDIKIAELLRILKPYQDLLLNDSMTGIAVLNPQTHQEIQLNEHKLLVAQGSILLEYCEFKLDQIGLQSKPNMRFITDVEHIHTYSEEYEKQFGLLAAELEL